MHKKKGRDQEGEREGERGERREYLRKCGTVCPRRILDKKVRVRERRRENLRKCEAV